MAEQNAQNQVTITSVKRNKEREREIIKWNINRAAGKNVAW